LSSSHGFLLLDLEFLGSEGSVFTRIGFAQFADDLGLDFKLLSEVADFIVALSEKAAHGR
jgi:hypothetical protein